jgi:hypothetical protein
MFLGVKHTFTNEGKCMRYIPMTPKCTPTLVVVLMRESWMFRALVEKAKKHQIGPPRYHWKGLEVKMPKTPLYCSFRLGMHELWSKERLGVKLGIWFLTINPLRARVKWSLDWGMLYTIGKVFLRAIRFIFLHVPKKLDLKKIWTSNVSRYQESQFWDSTTTKVGFIY